MSTTREVSFEPLALDGSNFDSWSLNLLNEIRTFSPHAERIMYASIMPFDSDDFNFDMSKLTHEELQCTHVNSKVANFMFSALSHDLQDSIYRFWNNDAHWCWNLIKGLFDEEDNDEQEEPDQESLEECSTSPSSLSEPQVTQDEQEDVNEQRTAGSLEQAVRPLATGGQTACHREVKSN